MSKATSEQGLLLDLIPQKKKTETLPKKSKKTNEEKNIELQGTNLPSIEEARKQACSLFALLDDPLLQNFLASLNTLATKAPQLILLEGNTHKTRFALALYWACALNCQSSPPCLQCKSCLEIANLISPDFLLYNGLEGSILIDDMRALKPIIAKASNSLDKRVIFFHEAQAFTVQSANSLLKILEEPSTTFFIMTSANRENLLPTLVSRSTTLTLPSPLYVPSNEEKEILDCLYTFFTQGTGFFEHFTAKKGFTKEEAKQILHLFSLALARAFSQQERLEHALSLWLAKNITAEKLLTITDFIHTSQEMIESSNAPNTPLIIDTLLVQSFLLLNEN